MSEEYKYPPRMEWANKIKELEVENERLSNQNFDLRTENEKLRYAKELLDALREFGVDNWNGYSDAIQSLR